MDLNFDHSALCDLAGYSPSPVEHRCTPDWPGLKARFVAAHALRREIVLQNAVAAGGSFTSETAGVLASRRENSQRVNRNASANCKPPHANEANIAGASYPASED